jgi:UDPglucose 6-dehydrogenase
VPVGSATLVEQVIGRPDIRVVSNPEFLREGSAVRDSLHPDRLVVGADDAQAAAKGGRALRLHRAPLIVTDATTSETIKYASNAFLATKLSYVNAVAGLCEEVGADVRDVMLGLGYDKRIGFEFLRPGPGGVGRACPRTPGPCSHRRGGGLRLLAAGRRHRQQRAAAGPRGGQGRDGLRRSLEGVTVGVWGLTFKANTDDRRDSPSLQIAHRWSPSGPRSRPSTPRWPVDPDDSRGDAVPDDLPACCWRRSLRGGHGAKVWWC